MDSPKVSYKRNKKNAGKLRKEFSTLFNDVYISGTRSKTGLGDTDEEARVKKLGKFLPGKIYTYQYDPLYKDKLDWFDTRPIILVMDTKQAGTGNWLVRGINLNFLPEEAKVQTLEIFYDVFQEDIEKSVEISFLGKINMNLNKMFSFFKDWLGVMSVFNDAGGVGYQYAYRTYIMGRIKNPRYVEYQHWEIIPFLNPEEIIGASVQEIYKTYWESQPTLIKGNKKKNK